MFSSSFLTFYQSFQSRFSVDFDSHQELKDLKEGYLSTGICNTVADPGFVKR